MRIRVCRRVRACVRACVYFRAGGRVCAGVNKVCYNLPKYFGKKHRVGINDYIHKRIQAVRITKIFRSNGGREKAPFSPPTWVGGKFGLWPIYISVGDYETIIRIYNNTTIRYITYQHIS